VKVVLIADSVYGAARGHQNLKLKSELRKLEWLLLL
jgi:hypothetical protein